MNKHIIYILFAAATVAGQALGFPTWMGVYGSFSRHSGGNPGSFTVLLNEDIAGLKAEIGISINGGPWVMHPMERIGFVSINSIWQYVPMEPFPAGTELSYFFHGFDASGGHIWDSRGGENYSLSIPAPVAVQWVGNVSQWPFNGSVTPRDHLWVNAESWPAGGAQIASIVYTTNNWASIEASPLMKAGQKGQNDWWHLNLGAFYGGTEIEYALLARDVFDNILWAHDNGANFQTRINTGRSTGWTGHQSHWPPNGSISDSDDFWVNVESWPRESALCAWVIYSVNGGVWNRDTMNLAGTRGNNDWWHINLEQFPPGAAVHYTTEVIDENGELNIPDSEMVTAWVNGSQNDADADGLPDDWEIYWWGNLNAAGSENHDMDGTPDMPMNNLLEYTLGTEPIHSNNADRVGLLWKPSRPEALHTVRFSYRPRALQPLESDSIFAHVIESPDNRDHRRGPLNYDSESERYDFEHTPSATTTNLTISFTTGQNIDNNMGVFWNIPVSPFNEERVDDVYADSDGDGVYDMEELQHGSNPFDPDSLPARAVKVSTGIQAAIDAVTNGAWVLLEPGLYEPTEPIRFRGKQITLRGIGDANETVIQPASGHRAFIFDQGEDRSARLERMTIRRAQTAEPGAALYCPHTSPSIRHVNFVRCSSISMGGAVYVEGGSPLFEHTTFSNCSSYAGGGGLAVNQSTGAVVSASVFSGNRAHGTSASGGAVYATASSFELTRSYMNDNSVDHQGGAIFIDRSTASIYHCTFTKNRSKEATGSSVHASDSDARINGSILWNNTDPEVAGDRVTVQNSIIQFVASGANNSNIRPGLVPDSFRLLADSPCINSGGSVIAGRDIDGEAISGAPDIGCDEFVDTNRNAVADIWEAEYPDTDNDTLNALAEYEWGTRPDCLDTDADGLPDGWETDHGLNPRDPSDALDHTSDNALPALYQFYHQPVSGNATNRGEGEYLSAQFPDGATIQEIIDATPDMGVIEIPAGIYEGPGNRDLVLNGKNVMITASNGAACVIDCGGEGRGITFGEGVDQRTLFRGITIKNGNVSSDDGEGGGIRCIGASPVIEACVIVSNRSEIGGGGIYLDESDAVIRGCLITDNIASYNWGGGIDSRRGNPRIEASRIVRNRVVGSGHYGGGGLFVSGGHMTITTTVIAENTAERNGGGAYIGYETIADFIHCTIVSNKPQGVYESGDASIINSILWGNLHNLVIANPSTDFRPPVFSVVGGYSDPSQGVTDANPMLRPDYMLTAESPCIDAGSISDAPDTDIDHEFRWDHPDHENTPSIVDIGVDEFVDLDLDGIDNILEQQIGSSPINDDTDGDGLSDGYEYFDLGLNPLAKDSDQDGFTDGEEVAEGMDPIDPADGIGALNAARRLLIAHWRTMFGSVPAFHHRAGSQEDLEELDYYLKVLSDNMVREVYP